MNSPVYVNLLLALVAQSSDLPDSKWLDSQQASRFVEFYNGEASQYDIYLGEQTKLQLRPMPIFRWANPKDANFNGTLYVWTHKGRAEVISSVWSNPQMTADGNRRIIHEFLTCASQSVRAERSGARSWYPSQARIDPKSIPFAPHPADNATRRLLQMRALAREFSATEIIDNKWEELRMLARPVYRYEPESTNSPDGAVFAFLADFDPEAFLIIEERETPSGRSWHFALAQFGIWPVAVRHKDMEVWACDRNNTLTDPKNSHFANLNATITDWHLSDPTNDDDGSR